MITFNNLLMWFPTNVPPWYAWRCTFSLSSTVVRHLKKGPSLGLNSFLRPWRFLLFLNPRRNNIANIIGHLWVCYTVFWRAISAFEAACLRRMKDEFPDGFANWRERWVTISFSKRALWSSMHCLDFNSESFLRADVQYSSPLLFLDKYHRSISVHASSRSVHRRLKMPRDKWSPGKQT